MLGIVQYLMEAKKKINVDEDKKQGISLLDDMLNHQSDITISDFAKIFVPNGPMIYAFITPKVKDAIKIGFTDQAPEKRIEQWRKIYDDEKNKLTCIGYWSSEEFNEIAKEKQFFWDHAVHDKLGKRGYHQFKDADDFYKHIGDELRTIHHSREFFRKYSDLSNEEKEELSDKILIDLINQMKQNIKEGNPDFKIYSSESKKEANEIWNKPASYNNTDLQKEAIKNGVKAIKDGKTKLLMAAVMRFGKTHTAYEIVKDAGLKTVLVTSAKADVRTAWRTDINHKHFIDNFVFVEYTGDKLDISKFNKKSGLVETYKNVIINDLNNYLDKDSVFIMFATLHDLGGSIKEIKAKHIDIFNRKFDIMIVDEAHYGSHANLFGKVTGLNEYDNEEDEDAQIESKADLRKAKQDANIIKDLSNNCKVMLEVSGTPYYILASNEFFK